MIEYDADAEFREHQRRDRRRAGAAQCHLRWRRRVSAALIGRNGAGKTTTVRTIMGFTEANGTGASWAARILGRAPPHRRPSLGLGYAPEDRRLFSAFTVEENILLPGRVAKLSA